MLCPTVNPNVQSPFALSALVLSACMSVLSPVSITDIQGPAFLSPLDGQRVYNVSGLVTAKGMYGFWIEGDKVEDIRVSNGLYVYSTSPAVLGQITVGDFISLGGIVSEYHSSPNYLTATEIIAPTDINIISSGNEVTPLILGVDRSPPTQELTALDAGEDGFLSVPNNQSAIIANNSTLLPDRYGLDFLASLEGQLVIIPNPTVANFNNRFKEIWVYGDWKVTGKNTRGGITMTYGPDGIPDANPEVLIVGSPLDKTKNPDVAIGQTLSNITGVVVQQFGYFYILPTTAPTVLSSPDFTVLPTELKSSDTDACIITVGDYNVENMSPTSSHVSKVADHIANLLETPDIMFLQEIQDNSGRRDDGTVSANVTLTKLVDAIARASSNGLQYDFLEVAPIDGEDGGQPGGNIRAAYLYRADKVRLAGNTTPGQALDATSVIVDEKGDLSLTFNPGRIDPTNNAWESSRKPLVALWESTLSSSVGERFFTVNLHMSSKSGSSPIQGNFRPPVNSGVDRRKSQVDTVAIFVNSVLAKDANASLIVGGDCNEFLMTRSVFASFDNILMDVDEVAGIPDVERYTYVFEQNTEQIDHIFVSNAIVARGVEVEHVHVNNWAPSLNARASDHDPSVAKVKVC